MFITIRLRKWAVIAVLVLLFLAIVAIIVSSGRDGDIAETAETVSVSAGRATLIIDAGHGGMDGGASTSGGLLESDVNLAIAEKLEALAKIFGIETVMTRESSELDYPETANTVKKKKAWDQTTRVELIESVQDGVLISIHQNTYPDPRPNGAQVLYAKTDGSQELGELTHANLIEGLDRENRRVAAPISDTIYLMKSISCPAVLVECGFLTNAAEAEKLSSDGYKTKLAVILLSSFMQYTA